MVKSWANEYVSLFESDFASKIDWDKVKEEHSVWTEEVREGWTYEIGAYYWPITQTHNTELYEITFKKYNIGQVKTKREYKSYSMWGEKRNADYDDKKGSYIKNGEWLYNGFLTKC
jgi:hypothetical protein